MAYWRARILIAHENLGIFVGAKDGIAYWSSYGTAGGAWCVSAFDSEREAREFVSTWHVPHCDPDDYSYVVVHAQNEWVSLAELIRAGLDGEWTEILLANIPAQGNA